ncbi:MAG TPA: phosphatase PAP2 family protein [Desulfobulbus sp.]|nr:phosphatase PAP2 family protein [Desulfobulbus sp.]
MNQHFNHIFSVIILLIGLSLLIFMSNADLRIARMAVEANNQWPGLYHQPWLFLYKAAPVPGILLAIGAFVVLCAGFIYSSLKKYRRQSVFPILLLALGPGLLVNVILKDHLGRPRPQELVEFGGRQHFVQFWQPGPAGRNSSFPCGHASIAFFLMAPWFIYRRRRRSLALCFLWLRLSFGLLVGVTRIMQGGHFLSDVLWAGGLVYITGELLSWLCLADGSNQGTRP